MFRSADAAHLLTALALGLAAVPASARGPDEPVANRTPDAEDVAMTPVTDLNLKRVEIPPVLKAAVANPYASSTIRECADITVALAALDGALGPDLDVAASDRERFSPGGVAKSVVASFIPFRGILREITGAADHQREVQAAIYAGAIRRGYLKGLGERMGCPYPARPAFARVEVSSAPNKPIDLPVQATSTPEFVSSPMVQGESAMAGSSRRPRR